MENCWLLGNHNFKHWPAVHNLRLFALLRYITKYCTLIKNSNSRLPQKNLKKRLWVSKEREKRLMNKKAFANRILLNKSRLNPSVLSLNGSKKLVWQNIKSLEFTSRSRAPSAPAPGLESTCGAHSHAICPNISYYAYACWSGSVTFT